MRYIRISSWLDCCSFMTARRLTFAWVAHGCIGNMRPNGTFSLLPFVDWQFLFCLFTSYAVFKTGSSAVCYQSDVGGVWWCLWLLRSTVVIVALVVGHNFSWCSSLPFGFGTQDAVDVSISAFKCRRGVRYGTVGGCQFVTGEVLTFQRL